MGDLPILDSNQILLLPISTRLQHLLVIAHCQRLHQLKRLHKSAAACLALHALALQLPTNNITPSLINAIHRNSSKPSNIWPLLRQLNELIEKQHAPRTALSILWETISCTDLQQEWLMAITPWACKNSVFQWVAERIDDKAWANLIQQRSRWTLTLALAWLSYSGRDALAYEVSDRLLKTPKDAGWLNTECILNTVVIISEKLEEVAHTPNVYLNILINISKVIVDNCGTVWERGHDACLTKSACLLVGLTIRHPSLASLRRECVHLVDAQSFNPAFWEGLGEENYSQTSWLSEQKAMISNWVSAFTDHSPPSAEDESFLARMIADGHSEAQRWYTEWLYSDTHNKPSHIVMSSASPAEFLRTCHTVCPPPQRPSTSKAIRAALSGLEIGNKLTSQPDLFIVFAKLLADDVNPNDEILRELTDSGFNWVIASPGPRTARSG
ncbi:MAG: hypothetical protein U5L74_02295 [Ideonella sp.]|nr:hypothetical protein [Ideonella sp.]